MQEIPLQSVEPPAPPEPIWRWTDVLRIGAGSGLLFIVGLWVIRWLSKSAGWERSPSGQPSLAVNIALALLEGVALVGGVYLLGLLPRRLDWWAVGLRRPSRGWTIAAIALGLSLIPLAGLLALLVRVTLGQSVEENPLVPFLAPQGFSWVGFFSMVFLGGWVAPFAEELFFRGVLFQWLKERWGFWTGALASALLFGIVHGEPGTAVAAFMMGLLMAWIFTRSRSLWTAILVHAVINTINIIALYAFIASGLQV